MLSDKRGRYLFFDHDANIAVLAIVESRDLCRWQVPKATVHEATLFVDTRIETHVTPEPDSLVVILPDLSQRIFVLAEGDVSAMHERAVRYPVNVNPYCVVENVLAYFSDRECPELTALLTQYR
ncbi:MAG: hypothetical protein KKB50_06705 [Planctomycetes bacterium]|nr:hypothetical protein [Planctomycetota bacterium]